MRADALQGSVTLTEGRPARLPNRAELDYARAIKHWLFHQPPLTETEAYATMAKRQHRATYSSDKRSGGYLVRVQGPNAERFAGREVPVTLKNGGEHAEELTKLIWTGNDQDSGEPVALYKFKAKPKQQEEIEF